MTLDGLFGDLGRIVFAAVIDNDELKIGESLRKDAVNGLSHVWRLVVERYDDGVSHKYRKSVQRYDDGERHTFTFPIP